MAEERETGLTITLKGGTGYDAPWIVIHAADVEGARKQMLDLAGSDLLKGTADLAKAFQAANSGKPAARIAAADPDRGDPNQTGFTTQQQSPQQLLQDNVGATVVSTEQNAPAAQQVVSGGVPQEVMVCPLHGPRKYFGPGVSERTGNSYNASYRCSERGCSAKPPKPLSLWQRDDSKWEEKPWGKR